MAAQPEPGSSPALPGGRTVLTAVSSATLAALPPMLLGGLAVLVRQELGFSAFQLGAAIAIFFTASGLGSVPSGVFSELVGPRRALAVGALITGIGLVGAGWLSDSWLTLVVWLAIGGAGNTITQVATNHLLARRVPANRQGLAYGIKQSAIPLAGMLAGLALPILGLSVGWRATYLLAALGLIPVLLLLRMLPAPSRRRGRQPRAGDAPVPALVVLSVGAGLGTAAGASLTAFIVSSATHAGFTAAGAGLLLTVGSLAGISVRVSGGWLADRLERGSLLIASSLVGSAVAGYLGLALNGPSVLTVVAALLAFAGGWGYQGLVLLAVARTNPRAPATAMGIVRTGPSSGAIFGPLIFGAVVDGPGYGLAWLLAAAAAAGAAALMLAARPALIPYRPAPTASVDLDE